MRVRKKRWLLRLAVVALLIVACVTFFSTREQATAASERLSALQTALEELKAANARLQSDIETADEDKVIEDIARSELGLVDPDDVVFIDDSKR